MVFKYEYLEKDNLKKGVCACKHTHANVQFMMFRSEWSRLKTIPRVYTLKLSVVFTMCWALPRMRQVCYQLLKFCRIWQNGIYSGTAVSSALAIKWF